MFAGGDGREDCVMCDMFRLYRRPMMSAGVAASVVLVIVTVVNDDWLLGVALMAAAVVDYDGMMLLRSGVGA